MFIELGIKKAYRFSTTRFRNTNLFVSILIFKSGGDDGHGAVLCADEGAHFDGRLMCLADRLAPKDLRHKRAGEGVSRADSVCYSYFGSRQERGLGVREDITTLYTTSEDEHMKVEVIEHTTAGSLSREVIVTEHMLDDHEFFIVNLEHVAQMQRLFDDLFGVERLTEVDVKDSERIGWDST